MPVPMRNGESVLYAVSHVLYVSCMPLLATESNTVFFAIAKHTPLFLSILKWQVGRNYAGNKGIMI